MLYKKLQLYSKDNILMFNHMMCTIKWSILISIALKLRSELHLKATVVKEHTKNERICRPGN